MWFHMHIRESVDSLCRDRADTPIVRVHWKAFLTLSFFSPHGIDFPRIVIAKLTEQFQGKRKM